MSLNRLKKLAAIGRGLDKAAFVARAVSALGGAHMLSKAPDEFKKKKDMASGFRPSTHKQALGL